MINRLGIALLVLISFPLSSFASRDLPEDEEVIGSRAWVGGAPPSVQKFTSSSGTYYLSYTFQVGSSITVKNNDVYRINSVDYHVNGDQTSVSTVVMYGSAAPLAYGTLSKQSGNAGSPSSIDYSHFKAPRYLRVRMIGGGGGGGGSGNSGGGTGSAGTSTTFNSTLLVANGGSGGAFNGAGGAGGSASLGTGAIGTAIAGAQGQGSAAQMNNNGAPGGAGAATPFAGGGSAGPHNSAGQNAVANSGAGGGGGGTGGSGVEYTGSGGGGGGFVDALIPFPTTSYTYAVGSGGGHGGNGANGYNGGDGAAGYIEITEYYD